MSRRENRYMGILVIVLGLTPIVVAFTVLPQENDTLKHLFMGIGSLAILGGVWLLAKSYFATSASGT